MFNAYGYKFNIDCFKSQLLFLSGFWFTIKGLFVIEGFSSVTDSLFFVG
jgi:hypothetical protein